MVYLYLASVNTHAHGVPVPRISQYPCPWCTCTSQLSLPMPLVYLYLASVITHAIGVPVPRISHYPCSWCTCTSHQSLPMPLVYLYLASIINHAHGVPVPRISHYMASLCGIVYGRYEVRCKPSVSVNELICDLLEYIDKRPDRPRLARLSLDRML